MTKETWESRQTRPWSTQYGEDFKKRRVPAKHTTSSGKTYQKTMTTQRMEIRTMETRGTRAWSTQYGEDFNKRRVPAKHKKVSHHSRALRPCVPKATEIFYPQPTRSYAGDTYGLEDPMLDDTAVYGDRCTPYTTVATTVADPACVRPYVGVTNTVMNDHQDDGEDSDFDPYQNGSHDAIIHSPEAVPVISEPVPLRSKTPEQHWICWPEPKPKCLRRPHTAHSRYTEQRQITPNKTPRNDTIGKAGDPVHFDPNINSWTNVSTENDRKAVAAMFASMKRSQTFYEPSHRPFTSISINEPPPKDTYTKYGGQVLHPDPRSLYQQSYFPYFQSHGSGPREAMALQQLARQMNGQEPAPFNYNYSFNKYPLHMRKNKRTAAKTDDYVHEQSMFMSTTPRCSGHFVIHPDWVSERTALRRSKSMIQIPQNRL